MIVSYWQRYFSFAPPFTLAIILLMHAARIFTACVPYTQQDAAIYGGLLGIAFLPIPQLKKLCISPDGPGVALLEVMIVFLSPYPAHALLRECSHDQLLPHRIHPTTSFSIIAWDIGMIFFLNEWLHPFVLLSLCRGCGTLLWTFITIPGSLASKD